MRKKMQRDALRKIAEIRSLQLVAAETLAEQAQGVLLKESGELERREAELGKIEEDWRDMVSRPVLVLETMTFWGQAVQQQDAQHAHARKAVDRATADHKWAVKAFYLAKQNARAADEKAKAAAGSYLRSLDEAALHEMADRHLQHGRKP